MECKGADISPQVLEKKLTNNGPLRESAAKHSIYTHSERTQMTVDTKFITPIRALVEMLVTGRFDQLE